MPHPFSSHRLRRSTAGKSLSQPPGYRENDTKAFLSEPRPGDPRLGPMWDALKDDKASATQKVPIRPVFWVRPALDPSSGQPTYYFQFDLFVDTSQLNESQKSIANEVAEALNVTHRQELQTSKGLPFAIQIGNQRATPSTQSPTPTEGTKQTLDTYFGSRLREFDNVMQKRGLTSLQTRLASEYEVQMAYNTRGLLLPVSQRIEGKSTRLYDLDISVKDTRPEPKPPASSWKTKLSLRKPTEAELEWGVRIFELGVDIAGVVTG